MDRILTLPKVKELPEPLKTLVYGQYFCESGMLFPECGAVCESPWDAFISGEDFKEQKDPDSIVVSTTAGNITAKQTPDSEYPGIIMELESQNGRPGVIMEYDPEKEDIFVRVWGKDNPDGDPIYVVGIGGKED